MFSLDEPDNRPLSVVTESNDGLLTIDSSSSEHNGEAVGRETGVHSYVFTRDVVICDPLINETPLTIVLGTNSVKNGSTYTKDITGNRWNSGVVSQETFDTNGIFAVSWEVDNIDKWNREMGGITPHDNDNVSYRYLTHSLYQLDNKVHRWYYENGTGTQHPSLDANTRTLTVGDRLGLRNSSGYVEYFIIKNGVIYPITRSTKLSTGLVKFMFSMNRGSTSNGRSSMENAWYHDGTTIDKRVITISGDSSSSLSEEDVDKFSSIGFIVNDSSTYAKLYLSRMDLPMYRNTDNSNTAVEMVHQFDAVILQDVKTF